MENIIKGEKMVSGIARPELWLTEVLRINSHSGGITEGWFGNSILYAMPCHKIKEYLPVFKRRKLL